MIRGLAIALSLMVLLGLGARAASGYFLAPAAGTAEATAEQVPPGPTPRVSVQGRTAVLAWDTVAFTTGAPVPAFAVTRTAAGPGGASLPATGGCAGTLTQRTCAEARLPVGTWTYAVAGRAGSAWLGESGSPSATVTIPAPALLLGRPAVGPGLPETITGGLTGFDVSEPITFRLDDAVVGDVLLGQPSSTAGDGTASVAIDLPATLAEGPHTLHAVGAGTDRSQAVAELLVDRTPPVTTDSTAAIGNAWSRTTQTVLLSATDAGSGVAATHWTIDGTTPTLASAAGAGIALADDGLYTPRYRSVDRVGNLEATRTAATTIRIDRTAPNVAAPSAGTGTIGNGQQLTTAATDPLVNSARSGVAEVAYFACAGACTPSPGSIGTLLIGSSTAGPGFAVTWTGQPADGTYSIAARATDAAGNATLSGTTVRIVDNAGPVVSAALADATANQAGFINGNARFYAYANASDAGVGVDAGTLTADLTGQCGTACAAVQLSAAGGPFSVLTAAGTITFAYRSAAVRTSANPSTTFSATASDLRGNSTTTTVTATIDQAGNPGTPVSVTLTNGAAATGFATCATTANGFVNAARAAASTIAVVTAANAPANGVVRVSASDGAATVTAQAVVPVAGTQTVTFANLDLTGLADGPLTLTAVEYTPGGKSTSSLRTQAVTKLTTAPAVVVGSLVHTDNTAPLPDTVTSTAAVGPANGFLAFTQTVGTQVGTTYLSTALSATGRLSAVALASETTRPTYAVAAVDAACNPSPSVTWSPSAIR